MRAHALITFVGALFFFALSVSAGLVFAQMDRLGQALAQIRALAQSGGAESVTATSSAALAALDAAATAARRTNLALFCVFLGTGAAVAACWSAIATHVLRPMQALAQGFAAIRAGDYAHRLPHRSADECGRLCAAFDEMAQTLETTTASRAALEAEVARRATLEDSLRRQNAALAQSNVELDAFAHIAAHDLRAPLRGVRSLAGWLREDLGAVCTPEAREHLDLLCGRVDRLEALLDALQSYSEIGRVPRAAARVRPAPLIAMLAAELDPAGRWRIGFEGSSEPFLAHAAALEAALRELLANAIKHHDRPEGRISVRLAVEGRRRIFTVTDDGPGVPPDMQERIFDLFQTLRPRDDVEGAGMGLPLIRKAARVHGGSLEVESPVADGRGCAFRLVWPTLPLPEP